MTKNPVLTHPLFLFVVFLNVFGPMAFGFSEWCNFIQYVGGFTIAYAIGHYFLVHRNEIKQQAEMLTHLKEHGIIHHVLHHKDE